MNTNLKKSSDTKILKVTPRVLADGTNSYNVPINYPEILVKKIKKISYKKDLNFTEVVLYCIEEESKKGQTLNAILTVPRGTKTSTKSVRFRESHVQYVEKFCAEKNINKFTLGVLNILYNYFNISDIGGEERI